MTGVGLFLGPAIGAAFMLSTDSFQTPLFVAGLGLLLSVLPLSFIRTAATHVHPAEQVSAWQEMRTGWQFIRRHDHVWQVLLCLLHLTLLEGAVNPLITPHAHQLGLGPGVTGIFFSAYGLGGLIGAPLVVVLAKRLGASTTLLLTGMLAPVGIVIIGLMDNHVGALAAFMLTALAGTNLNVIVLTVLQRLTPSKIQGRVFGVEQTSIGIAWVFSLATITGFLAIWSSPNTQMLFLVIGGVGFWNFLACWFWHHREIRSACEMCEPRIQVLGAVCRLICRSRSPLSGTACRVICGSQLRCCH